MAQRRASRPRPININVDALLARWRPLAALRSTPYSWDGSELKIFSCEERYAFKVSNEAADVWRVMAKDTRNLKKRMSTASILGLAQPLQQLLAHVVLQAEDEYVVSQNVQGDNSDHDVDGFDTDKVEEATQRDGQTLELEDINGLFDADFKDIADPDIVSIDNDDGGELADVMQPESEIEPAVEFVSQICRCPECVAKAKRPIPIPNPGIGSQRRETLATVKGKVRLHSKTTVPSTEPKKGVQTKLKKHAGPIALPIQLEHRKKARGLFVGWRYLHRLHVDPHESLLPQSHAEAQDPH